MPGYDRATRAWTKAQEEKQHAEQTALNARLPPPESATKSYSRNVLAKSGMKAEGDATKSAFRHVSRQRRGARRHFKTQCVVTKCYLRPSSRLGSGSTVRSQSDFKSAETQREPTKRTPSDRHEESSEKIRSLGLLPDSTELEHVEGTPTPAHGLLRTQSPAAAEPSAAAAPREDRRARQANASSMAQGSKDGGEQVPSCGSPILKRRSQDGDVLHSLCGALR